MSYTYVIQGGNVPALTKIGVTDQAPEVLAQELSDFGDPGHFVVVRQWRLKNAEFYAKRVFGVLGGYRVSGEDFRLPAGEAIRRITVMLHAWGVVNDEGLTREEAAAQCAERERIETAKRIEEEAQRQINAEVAGAEAETARQFQGPSFTHRICNALVWCMTWAIIVVSVHVELADRLRQPGWQYLAHLVGLIGLYLVLRGPSAKWLAERDDAMRKARLRVLSAYGLPASWRPSP
jgi:hypothetical protein